MFDPTPSFHKHSLIFCRAIVETHKTQKPSQSSRIFKSPSKHTIQKATCNLYMRQLASRNRNRYTFPNSQTRICIYFHDFKYTETKSGFLNYSKLLLHLDAPDLCSRCDTRSVFWNSRNTRAFLWCRLSCFRKPTIVSASPSYSLRVALPQYSQQQKYISLFCRYYERHKVNFGKLVLLLNVHRTLI